MKYIISDHLEDKIIHCRRRRGVVSKPRNQGVVGLISRFTRLRDGTFSHIFVYIMTLAVLWTLNTNTHIFKCIAWYNLSLKIWTTFFLNKLKINKHMCNISVILLCLSMVAVLIDNLGLVAKSAIF